MLMMRIELLINYGAKALGLLDIINPGLKPGAIHCKDQE